jgi:hypothetical protein
VAALGRTVAASAPTRWCHRDGVRRRGSGAGIWIGPAYSGLTRHDADGVVTSGPALILHAAVRGRAFHSATTLQRQPRAGSRWLQCLNAGRGTAGQMLTSTVRSTSQEPPGRRQTRRGHFNLLDPIRSLTRCFLCRRCRPHRHVGSPTTAPEPPMETGRSRVRRIEGFDVGSGTGVLRCSTLAP